MRRAYKYRLYPNTNQRRELESALETHRRLYNNALEIRIKAWKNGRVSIGHFDQTRWFTRARRVNPWYQRIGSNSGMLTLRRLDQTYRNFFGGRGFPRFRSRNHFNSFTFRLNQGCRIVGGMLYLFGIGEVKMRLHREWSGQIKTVAIKREAGQWYAILSCDLGDVRVASRCDPSVGLDVGLKSFLTTSDGETVDNPRFLNGSLKALRRAQRALSRKERGSNRRKKSVMRIQRIHKKVADCRKDFHHKTARNLVDRYGLIAVERLNVRGMLGSRRLARHISDAGWYGFVRILKAKAESAGSEVVGVDPRGTTQECSGCGTIVPKDLTVRAHDCPSCGLRLDRDHNAALNILARAEPAGANVGEVG